MATDLAEKRPSSATKFENFVEQELNRVRNRIRLVDVGLAALLFLVVTLTYALGMVLLERFVGLERGGLGTGVRVVAFVLYALAALFALGLTGLRLYRRINPYYAARQLEQTLPDAKNSMVNWLDLREEKLPSAIRAALGQKAARDLKKADPELATNPGRIWLLTAVAAGLVLALLLLWVTGPNQFLSLLDRAFFPFRDTSIATRTDLVLLEPKEGDATVPLGQKVPFRVQLTGRVPQVNEPDSAALHYRYNRAEPFVRLPLEEDVDRTWAAVLVPDQVQNGFWYKISAGDAETPEYQVRVQSQPQVTKFEAKYKYRPYLQLPERSIHFPNETAVFPKLIAHRGTQVTLLARTNRALAEGRLALEAGAPGRELPGEVLPDEPRTVRFQFVMEKSGHFRVLFTSKDSEQNIDRSAYPIEVLDDTRPKVELTKPGQDIKLPANGTLELEGKASDDFGIKSMALQLRVVEGDAKRALETKIYRPGKSFRFANESYPDYLDYKDVVALDKLKTPKGDPFPLKPGTILEYWLEARDCSDYPDKDGNLGKSEPVFKVLIVEPDKDQKKQEHQRKKAEERQKEHEKNQDRQHGDQNDEIKENQQNQAGPKKGDPKKDKESEKQLDDMRNRLQKEIEKQKQEDAKKGKADGDPSNQPKADAKDGKPDENKKGPGQAKGSKDPENKENAGQQKDSPKDQQPGAGQAKNDGQKKDSNQQNAGQSKTEGQQPPEAGNPGTANKDQKGSKDSQAGTAKGGPKDGTKEEAGSAKDQAGQKPKDATGQAQAADPNAKVGEGTPKADNKDLGKGEPNAQAKDDKMGQGSAGQTAKSDNRKPPPDQGMTQAKEPPKDGPKENVGAAKGNNGKDAPETPPGQAAGNKAEETRAAQKNGENGKGPDQPPQASAKASEAGKKKGPAAGENKNAPPAQDGDAGLAKADRDLKNKNAGDRPAREPTLDDITKLKEEWERNGRKVEDKIANELSRDAREAKDEKVRDAARDLLEKMGRGTHGVAKDAEKTEDKDTQGTAKEAGPKGMGNDPTNAAVGKTGPQKSQEAGKSEGPSQGPPPPEITRGDNKGGSETGSFGPGSPGMVDDPRPKEANPDFARRGGDLQLEELKNRVTDEIRKRAGVSDEEWQRFLKDAEAYQRRLQREARQANKIDLRGDLTQIRGSGLRQIRTTPNGQQDPLTVGQGVAPPEFRDAHRRFTLPAPKKQ
jgi:collagen type III alpha